MNRSASEIRRLANEQDSQFAVIWLCGIVIVLIIGGRILFGVVAMWSPSEIVALMAVLFGVAIAFTALYFWRQVTLAKTDATLKQSMLQRGLTPDEIERLLANGPASQPPVDRPVSRETR